MLRLRNNEACRDRFLILNTHSKPCPEFLPQVLRLWLIPNNRINLLSTAIQIHIHQLDKLSPVNDLVSNPEHNEQDKTDVGNKEALRIPRNERRKTLREDNKHIEEESVISNPRLKRRFVRQTFPRGASHAKSPHEADMAEVDAGPSDESGHGSDVQKPAEDFTTLVAQVQEAKKTKCGGYCDSHVWHTAWGDALEEARGEAFAG
jgi:hypothetical protein